MHGFTRLVDYFIRHPHTLTIDQRYRQRLLVGIIFACLSFLVFFDIWFFYSGAAAQTIWINTLLTGILIGCYCSLLIALKRINAFWLAAQISTLLAFTGLAAGVYVSGGPFDNSSTPLLIIPAVMAFLLLGRKAGIGWGVAVFGLFFTMVAADMNGYEFPRMAKESDLKALSVIHWSYTMVAVLGLVMVYEQMNRKLTIERDDEKRRFEFMALHDPLTHLANRKLYDETLQSALARADRQESVVALFIIDLDGFKPINDNFGHEAGDAILKNVASQLTRNVRKTDLVARIGGDEFAIITEYVKDDLINVIGEKLLKAVSQPVNFRNKHLSVQASIGVALYPLHTKDEETLRRYSDEAMYAAKARKNRWLLFDKKMSKENQLNDRELSPHCS